MARSRKRRKARVIVVNPPRRRRRHRVRARSRRRRAPVMLRNEPRRRRRHRYNSPRRRHYRRNAAPGLPTTGFVMDAMYVTGGFFVTRMTAGYVLPMLGTMGASDIARILTKGGVAWGLGWVGGNFLGRRNGQLIMLGGLVEALSDAVRTYVSPFVPALADGVGSYPMLTSYPNLRAGRYDDEENLGARYDEAL